MGTLVSTPSATATVTATTDGTWRLKDPLDPTSNITVQVKNPPKYTRAEQNTSHLLLGRTRPLITTDVVTGADGTLTLLTLGNTAYTALLNLKLRQTTLLLQSPFGEQWYIRLVGNRETTLEASPTGNGYRTTTASYLEVDVPAL